MAFSAGAVPSGLLGGLLAATLPPARPGPVFLRGSCRAPVFSPSGGLGPSLTGRGRPEVQHFWGKTRGWTRGVWRADIYRGATRPGTLPSPSPFHRWGTRASQGFLAPSPDTVWLLQEWGWQPGASRGGLGGSWTAPSPAWPVCLPDREEVGWGSSHGEICEEGTGRAFSG